MWKDHLSKGGNTGFAVFKTNGSSRTALSSGVLIKVVQIRETVETEIPNMDMPDPSQKAQSKTN